MKKTLAEQVASYIAHRGEGYTPAKLAADVAALQRDLPERRRCKRQNIEQLLEKGFGTVLYLPALAAAMGTTVETLHAGQFVPGREPAPPPVQPPAALPYSTTKVREVPVVGKGSGGAMPERIWTDGDYPVGKTGECAEIATNDPHAFLVGVDGPSMIPRYNPGEFALVEPGTEPELEDDVLVRLASGETMIKRLLSRRGGWRFGSYNNTEVLHYTAEEVTWVYYVAHPVPRRKIKSRC